LVFGTGNGTGFKTSSGFGTKTEPRPSSKIGTKEPVLSLDQKFLKIIQPVLALSQGFEKSKNWGQSTYHKPMVVQVLSQELQVL